MSNSKSVAKSVTAQQQTVGNVITRLKPDWLAGWLPRGYTV